ncbi:hypothetical protein E4659_06690 [Dickeya dianthicola]|nr:MFS transporter [Dickeya dianthicola]MZG41872.1 MFS transporter [Dickeya dianthicola]MZH98419.1 MFS transporter [Dickeya dianthicola]UOO21087.1 hypothetical protein E4659_06690 [Dickeya dianthicola]
MSSTLSSSTPGQSQRLGDKAIQAGRPRVMPAVLAVASASTLGYTGILAGPARRGFIAQWSSLSLALGLAARLLLVVSLSIRPLTRSSGA